METTKAKDRRTREGWFARFAPEGAKGLDIGCQHDPLNRTYRRWDIIFGDGDAQKMDGLDDEMFEVVYAYHVLEHLDDPVEAVSNWLRILKTNGRLIVGVPHRDLYEKRRHLPSRWNHEHKTFWHHEESEGDTTLCLRDVVSEAASKSGVVIEIIDYRVCDEGYDFTKGEDEHASGEYTIECICEVK